MSRFHNLAHYAPPPSASYRLLPFRFTRLGGNRYVLTNAAAEFLVATREELYDFAHHKLAPGEPFYSALKSRHFLIDNSSDVALDLLALKLRTKLSRLPEFTGLHIFVVTLRCEHSCPYCQVSRQSDDRTAFDMTPEAASRALDLVFRSPARALKIEFQGGEPLLNFELIRQIVLDAKARNGEAQRDLQFVIATNLAVVTDEMLGFCADHGILISTSLDGPEDLHNRNRPRPGRDSHQRTISGIARVREACGRDSVSALMTTTEASLGRVRDIIDEYLLRGFNSIFLRQLSPYGFAVKTRSFDSYGVARWLEFYRDGLAYILELNRRGVAFSEQYSALILTKMLTPFEPGYVDLMSPAGIGAGVLVFNYDGDIYASDESRMLAEMGDKTFRLGNVLADGYEQIIASDALLDPLEQSFAGSAPMCVDCAFEPYCGADPVFHHATQGSFVGHKPTSGFCQRNMGVFRHLIGLLTDDAEAARVLRRWAL